MVYLNANINRGNTGHFDLFVLVSPKVQLGTFNHIKEYKSLYNESQLKYKCTPQLTNYVRGLCVTLDASAVRMDLNTTDEKKSVNRICFDILQTILICNKQQVWVQKHKILQKSKMQKQQQLEKFLKLKIQEIDQNLCQQTDDMAKLKLATMRASYAKMLQSFLKDQSQLSRSYFQQSIIYLKNKKFQQAISQGQLARIKLPRSQKTPQMRDLSQNINLVLVQCYYKSNKSEDAFSIIEQVQVESQGNKEKYLSLKGQIYQAFDDQVKSRQNYSLLRKLVVSKHGSGSLEEGLCLIKAGKNIGHFKEYQQGVDLINRGMEILINHMYHNPEHVAQVYEDLAELCREVKDFEKEYSSLVCAYSMIKQLQQNQQRRNIEVLHKLSSNCVNRKERQKALQFLTQIEQIQRKIFGESSLSLVRTVKKIISLLNQLNRTAEARKYQNQYQHLLGSRVLVSPANTVSRMTSPNSIKRTKLSLSNNYNPLINQSVTRPLNQLNNIREV